MKIIVTVFIVASIVVRKPQAQARGLMLLYRPLDISTDCAFSRHLRYDLSFGMGMSDTITLVMRTMKEIDYECQIEIVTEREDRPPYVVLVVVVRFPSTIGFNCQHNPSAFILLKKQECFLLCDLIESRDVISNYFASVSMSRFRFQFSSNSSINSDINANLYEVTATSARRKNANETCNKTNETICTIDNEDFCFTSGVVCDGIKHCGADDWFDERKSECDRPGQQLGLTPVVAVCALVMCIVMVTSHILLQCLPPLANSFFIFNTNEDNRLCIDPKFKSPDSDADIDDKATFSKKKSLIPVDSSSDGEEEDDLHSTQQPPHHRLEENLVGPVIALLLPFATSIVYVLKPTQCYITNIYISYLKVLKSSLPLRKQTLRSMSEGIQRRLRKVAGRVRSPSRTRSRDGSHPNSQPNIKVEEV